MIVLLELPRGKELLIGRPSQGLPEQDLRLLSDVLKAVPGLQEAHLPQVFIEGVMDSARQVLVVVFSAQVDASTGLSQLTSALESIIPEESHLDVWPLEDGSRVLTAVRETSCRLELVE